MSGGSAKRTFRFYVGDEQTRISSSYSISTYRGCVYLAGRTLGSVVKLSAHSSGKCLFGFTQEYWSKNFDGPRRSSARWMRAHPGLKEYAIVCVMSFPTDFMKSQHDVEPRKEMKCLPPAASGCCVNVVICIGGAEVSGGETHFQNCELLFSDALSAAENLLVFAQRREFQDSPEKLLELMNAPGPRLEANRIAQMKSGDRLEDLHLLAGTKPKDGEPLRLMEITGVKFTKF